MYLANTMQAVLVVVATLFFGDVSAEPPQAKIDYMQTIVEAKKAVEAGKQGKADLLVQSAEEALKHAREQSRIRLTPASQRITEDLRAALHKAKEGKIEEATRLMEEAIANMK